MKKLLSGFFFLSFLVSCNDGRVATSDSDVDAARNFIRSSLDNDLASAKQYIVQDSTNIQYLEVMMGLRGSRPKSENQAYKEASIRIYDTRKVNDSVSIISYSNSYKNEKDSLKVVRANNQWLVDLKYSFSKD